MLGIFGLSAALKETELDKYQAGLTLLEAHNIDYIKASNLEQREEIFPGANYFSTGTVKQRLQALSDLNTNAFLSLKGGYGAQQCLAELDPSVFHNSSVFAYSDLTALFLKLQKDTTVKLFHSPMLVELSSLKKDELESFLTFLRGSKNIKASLLQQTLGLRSKLEESFSFLLSDPSYIWGGNLTLLLSMNIKPVIKKGYKKILFIEDCYEEAYKVERMLYTAANLGLFDDIDELWLGESQEALFNTSLIEKFKKEYGFNLVKNLPFGHSKKFTLPIFQYYD